VPKFSPQAYEYEEVGFSLFLFLKNFFIFYFLIFLPLIIIHQESFRAGGLTNNLIRKYIYKQGNLHDYLSQDPIGIPFDKEITYCDYRNMTPKIFYNEYVRKGRPCLFKDYAKIQKAYHRWSNETYLRETAGHEIIWAERQRDNRFAYFTEGAKRVYMPYGEFLDNFKIENRTFHYYYSFAEPPGKLNEDLELPPIMDALFDIDKVTYWHGHGTLTRPHTDAMENMMCVYEGYKNFSIVHPEDRAYIYPGTEGYPDNYSPCEFVAPDYNKYPLLEKARIKT